MPARSLTVALCLLSSSVLAQTTAAGHDDVSRGSTLPPTSAALASEATAIAVNPASLTYVGEAQLFFVHERSIARSQIVDSLYLADTFFDSVGAGFSLDWVRGSRLPDYRKTAYALSFGATGLSLGASLNLFSSSESTDLDGLSTFDLGLSGRPSRYFSYGLVVRNVDAPTRGTITLGRQYDLAVGIRPAGERVSLGVDYLFDDSSGLGGGRLGYTALARVVAGLSVGAGVSHGLGAGEPLFLQLSATVDTASFGVTYSPSTARGEANHAVAVRLSRGRYPSVLAPSGKIALFDLDDLLAGGSSPALSLLGVRQDDPWLRLTRLLDGAARDPNLRGVIFKLSNSIGGMGKAEELRHAILRLRASGKKVIALLFQVGDAEYLAASAADRIYAAPASGLQIDGFQAGATFFGGAMDKLGVTWDVARVGAYKNAPDAFTRTEMSKEQREAIEAYLDTDVRTFEAAVSKARSLTPEQVRAALDEGLKTPQRAKELGLIDEVLGQTELEKKLEELIPDGRYDARYRPNSTREDRWGERRAIAIIPVIGNIAGGKSREDPAGVAEIAGAETVIRALERARSDPTVAAIVLRIDSGGGSVLASDLMYRAVLEAREKKPVIASMGDVAASGGYYVAMGADEIFAQPTTITGSIGVFFLKPAIEKLAEKVGVTQQTIRRNALTGMLSFFSPWTAAERAAAQKWVDATYDDFITEVARSRKLTKPQVDAIARGRVWSGADARDRKLVDQLGGLLEAVAAARTRADVPEGEDLELLLMGEPGGLFSSAAGEEGVLARLLPEAPPPRSLPPGLHRLAVELGLDQALEADPGVMAKMEYQLTVR